MYIDNQPMLFGNDTEMLFATSTSTGWSWGFTDGTDTFTGENSMPDFGDSHQVLQAMSELLIEMAQTQLNMNYQENEDE
ncbi:MAG: hypothetical protein E7I59_01130 [Phytobacter diazotrophicus]|nr:hypothetical protein [Phytobacter diazotrophicus]